MTADVNHIVNSAHDPEVAVLVSPGPISRKVYVLNLGPVLFAIPFIITPNSPQHRGPGPFDYQITALICAYRLSFTRHHVSFYAGKWLGSRAGFCRCRTRKRRDHDCAGLSLPPGVDNWASFFSDHLVVPHPGFWVD